jgi:hypothetical protein
MKKTAICKMSKTQLKVFGLISNCKYINGVPYSDPTQFLSTLCSFSRDFGVIYYPTKCKGLFSFDFGQLVFIEELGFLGWMEMSAQCKLIYMTDFSLKVKRPNLPKLYTIADLLVCVVNLINLLLRIFKPFVVDEITWLKAFLHRNQNETKEQVQQSPVIVERLGLDERYVVPPQDGFGGQYFGDAERLLDPSTCQSVRIRTRDD